MNRDQERVERNRQALKDAGIDVLVCSLPMNVLLLSGYWPVVGTSLAVFTSEGRSVVLAPEDEKELAAKGWADEVQTFQTGSLDELKSPVEAVGGPLRQVGSGVGRSSRVGFESATVSEPASYAAMNLYGMAIDSLLDEAFPHATRVPAGDVLSRLRSTLTPMEIAKVRVACSIAQEAFIDGASKLREGLCETQAAAAFRRKLSVPDCGPVERADGFTYCMSGENSYEASAAFQRSRARQLHAGDLALVHCNSYADGFWTDITRTFSIGEPDDKKREMYKAVLSASQAAIDVIRPGIKAKDVDAAARDVLEDRGFGKEFVHGLGHAVGFHAIDHNARPRLHPASHDVLQTGMVFNVEPAVYIKGFGGMRHCDMVAVTEAGSELLTPFQSGIEQMAVS